MRIAYFIGVAILALVIFANYDQDKPAPPLMVDSAETRPGTPFPPIHNSPDIHCDFFVLHPNAPIENETERQSYYESHLCTDEEFAKVLGTLQRQWSGVPEWLRTNCVSNSTAPSVETCILRETIIWLNTNRNGQAPWVEQVSTRLRDAGK
jgi:hypothetical protein